MYIIPVIFEFLLKTEITVNKKNHFVFQLVGAMPRCRQWKMEAIEGDVL